MNEVKLKKGKHLILIEVSGDFSPDSLEKIGREIKAAGNFEILLTQPSTTVTVLTLED